MPMSIPIPATMKNSPDAFMNENWPVNIAAKAKRKTMSEEASLIRLSPSRIVTTRFGIFKPCRTDVAATASGGEMIAPSKNPCASEKFGITAWAMNAMPVEVNITNPKDNRLIGRLNFQNSFQEVFQAAAYKSGGRKIRNTTSGWRTMIGMAGMKLINKPATTKKMGYEIFNLILSMDNIDTANKSAITNNKFSCNMVSKIIFF